MSNKTTNEEKIYHLLETVKELKQEQKDQINKFSVLTQRFYDDLKIHMDQEDIRWVEIQATLEHLKIEQAKLDLKLSNHAGIFNKLYVILVPIIAAVATSYLVI